MWQDHDGQHALRLLDLIERREYELLLWGHIDGFFTSNELADLATEVADRADEYVGADDLLDVLKERHLLFEFTTPTGERGFRSRFAEGVRLFANLRQIFKPEAWADAPRLVADYRLSVEPRRFPIRSIAPDDVTRRLAATSPLSDTETEVLDALLRARTDAPTKLAAFQVEATRTIRGLAKAQKSHGVMVCAGTGSGKTLAFYLPCLMTAVDHIEEAQFYPQAVAIYPRKELLKDQLAEAFAQARRLDTIAQAKAGRKVRIGAYFGSTPMNAEAYDLQRRSDWVRRGGSYLCPHFACPDCGGHMVWSGTDLSNHIERLRCANTTCGRIVGGDELALTRNGMQRQPPDILFTTTEMLNREMSNTYCRRLFGLQQAAFRSPRMVLLDEAHSYSGVHGAHVGLLLRRWRHLVNSRPVFVGLSATLTDAAAFFSRLVGIPDTRVEHIEPGQDIEQCGHSYQLILRGDPVSATSLLSTTIQAGMLLGRLQDHPASRSSGGAYGTKTFAFTDNLDVTNRLYHNIQDAEGLSDHGVQRANAQPLAAVRGQLQPEAGARFAHGQAWTVCERIGHDLRRPLTVGRTSSQDAGLNPNCQLVVTTASLELGYDDPDVGAVIQHKAPLSASQFIQRQGRAGRRRECRPWSVAVLSDYGRDRLAYQFYEQLFSPVLPRQPLPIGNRYVLRIQMVYALLDWLALRAAEDGYSGSVWGDTAKPLNGKQRQRQMQLADAVAALLEDEAERCGFVSYLTRALAISDDEAQALFWEPPRALCTAVLPTLLRRLRTNWRRVLPREGEATRDYFDPPHPLPDFTPAALFNDLNVPDVLIEWPQVHGEDSASARLGITQALKESAPGKVTRRFATEHGWVSHWVPLPELAAGSYDLAVQSFCPEFELFGPVRAVLSDGMDGMDIPCHRPWRIVLQQVPQSVLPTSNAFLDWRTQIYPTRPGTVHEVPASTGLASIVRSITFHTHNHRCPVVARRFAVGAQAGLRQSGQDQQDIRVRFVDAETGKQAAVGFGQMVDGVSFTIGDLEPLVAAVVNGEDLTTCRTSRFVDVVKAHPALRERANVFRLGWLADVCLSLILKTAIEHDCDLQAGLECLRDGYSLESVDEVLHNVFDVIELGDELDGVETEEEESKRGYSHDELRSLFADADVRGILHGCATVLYDEPDDAFREWIAARLRNTLGYALLHAVYLTASDCASDELHCDLSGGEHPDHTNDDDRDQIWITEATVGGTGIVEHIYEQFVKDPKRFWMLVEMGLGMSDYENIDVSLTRVVELSQDAPDVCDAMASLRHARDHDSAEHGLDELRQVLSDHGIMASRTMVSALFARILRPGSTEQTDSALRAALDKWRELEGRLGLEIDLRLFCHIHTCSSSDVDALRQVGEGGAFLNTRSILYSMLWPRGMSAREQTFAAYYNPYAERRATDPLLLRNAILDSSDAISICRDDWADAIRQLLESNGAGTLVAPRDRVDDFYQAILHIVSTPQHAGFLSLFPVLVRVANTENGIAGFLHLREI